MRSPAHQSCRSKWHSGHWRTSRHHSSPDHHIYLHLLAISGNCESVARGWERTSYTDPAAMWGWKWHVWGQEAPLQVPSRFLRPPPWPGTKAAWCSLKHEHPDQDFEDRNRPPQTRQGPRVAKKEVRGSEWLAELADSSRVCGHWVPGRSFMRKIQVDHRSPRKSFMVWLFHGEIQPQTCLPQPPPHVLKGPQAQPLPFDWHEIPEWATMPLEVQ